MNRVKGGKEGGETCSVDQESGQEETEWVTPSSSAGRRLTDEEAQRVKQLMREGMSASWARKTVLGEDA